MDTTPAPVGPSPTPASFSGGETARELTPLGIIGALLIFGGILAAAFLRARRDQRGG